MISWLLTVGWETVLVILATLATANLGVLVALAIGFVVTLAFSRAAVRAEEAAPVPAPAVV